MRFLPGRTLSDIATRLPDVRICLVLFSLLLCGAVTPPSLYAHPTAAAEGMRVKSGTGFFVTGDGLVVTSEHVVSGCPSVVTWSRRDGVGSGRVIALDVRRDIALIATVGSSPGSVAAKFRPGPYSGGEIFALAFGVIADDPKKPILITGKLLGSDQITPAGKVLVVHAEIREGSSGGPVVDDAGLLLGMIIGYYTDNPELGVALPSAEIQSFLKAHGIRLSPNDALLRPARSPQEILTDVSVLVQCRPAEPISK